MSGEKKVRIGGDDMVVPGNNRTVQKRRSEGRRLFGKRLKEAFLESFSCTANVAASAAEVGVSEGCVYTHRRKDPEFRAGFWAALEQATAKLAALRLQREIERAEGKLAPELGAAMDGPPDARQIADLVKLMAALRGLSANLAGPATGLGQHGGGPAVQRAGRDEVCAALAKRLKAFGVKEGVLAPSAAAATDGATSEGEGAGG
jgi:hypothetical protein